MLRRILLSLGCVLWLTASIAGDDPCVVSLAPEDDLAQRLRACILKLVDAQIAEPDQFSALAYRLSTATPLRQGTWRVEPIDIQGPNQSGIVQILLSLQGPTLGEARASVRGRVTGPALVPQRALPRGQRIRRADVEVSEVDLTRLSEAPLRSIDEIDGLVPVRTLSLGRPLTASLLEPEPLVRRGDAVDILVRRGSLVVTARGIAGASGALGDTIPVENTQTGAELMARVRELGVVDVVGRKAGGRR